MKVTLYVKQVFPSEIFLFINNCLVIRLTTISVFLRKLFEMAVHISYYISNKTYKHTYKHTYDHTRTYQYTLGVTKWMYHYQPYQLQHIANMVVCITFYLESLHEPPLRTGSFLKQRRHIQTSLFYIGDSYIILLKYELHSARTLKQYSNGDHRNHEQ